MLSHSVFSQLTLPVALIALVAILAASWSSVNATYADEERKLTAEEIALVRQFEQRRVKTIEKVFGSVIAIYGEERQGGGSGVIIDPSGIGLTNHHVIVGAGTRGWGGLADGKLYRWELIGTDPGGDVALIQLKGEHPFPFTPLGDSDTVRVGDWAIAMGNPFVLTEDQKPTVTLGIVSGVKRYQPGAGKNQLVYGNCIQIDSSINPGNSGGPLFNAEGEVIGINGRGSFKERGRVNVGLGYAISSNQIKNFIPDLLATKLVEHGTLDAKFEDRQGKVLCSNVFEDASLYRQGVRPGSELLRFEGEPITSANHFTNLICTLPEDWPATLDVRNPDGKELSIHTRLYGLPYAKPSRPPLPPNEKDQTPEQREQLQRAQEMIDLLSAEPGTIRSEAINQRYAGKIVERWIPKSLPIAEDGEKYWIVSDEILNGEQILGHQQIWICPGGRFKVETTVGGNTTTVFWDGSQFMQRDGNSLLPEAGELHEQSLSTVQAICIVAANSTTSFQPWGKLTLDGSDRAQGINAFRMRVDADDAKFPVFFWLSMDTPWPDPIRLLKVGFDWNCERSGGLSFSGWKQVEGLNIATHRQAIKGLAEQVSLTFKMKSVEAHGWTSQSFAQLGFPETEKGGRP